MKSVLLCAGVLGWFTLSACGQADVMIKQKAKDLANQNNARQGVPPASAPAASGPAPMVAAPAPPKPSVQQQNIARLRADLAAVHREGKATDALKQQFAHDVLAIAQGTGRPSAATLAHLSDTLLTALAAKSVSTAADEKLVQKLVVLLNSAGLSVARTQELADEAQVALQSAGVSAADGARINAYLKSIAVEVQQTSRL